MDESLLFGVTKDHCSYCQLDDPWDLQPYFLLRKNMWKCMRTYSGYWKEKEEERIAIRSAGDDSSSSSSSSSSAAAAASPPYVGVRKTLEFYLSDGTRGGEGTKTDWICHDYHHLRKDQDAGGEALFLQEDVVLRKVFKKRNDETDHASSVHRHVESCVKAYKELSSRRELLWRAGVSVLENCAILPMDTILEYEPLMIRIHSILESGIFSESTQSEEALCIELSELLNIARRALADSTKKIMQRPPSPLEKVMSELIQSAEAVFTGASELVNKRLRVLKKDLGAVPRDPDGKSDSNVWKHFTKICSTSDADEVYAACRRCDKVLKAHPKKHGTSHLARHTHTCSSCTKPNPSTDEDHEMLHRLRTALENPDEQLKLDYEVDLTQLNPWDLNVTRPTPWYVTRYQLNRQTQGGHWKEINKEFTAIRVQMQGCWKDTDKEITSTQMDRQFQAQLPQYIGLRRTLQFQDQDGRKMDWMMLEYQQLDDIGSPALLLQGCMVIRRVLRYDKDAVSSAFSKLDRWLNADDGDAEYFSGEGVNADTTTPSSDYMDTPVDKKRKRTAALSGHKSQVWMHFTKIYSTDYGVVHVVCHTCDRGYSSCGSKNGTSHLRRHARSCASKHPSTGNAKDATTEWETEIWPLFLLLKNYGETEH